MRLLLFKLGFVFVFLAATALDAQQVLLIPDSTNDTIGTYDPFDGSLLDANFIVSAGEMSTPINAIDSGNQTILLSDQIADAILEYGFDGTFLGTVLDSTDGIDNVRGIAMESGALLASIGSGTFADTIQRYDLLGNQSTVISGPDPFDVIVRSDDILVSNIAGTDQVESYDFSGILNFEFDSTIEFPEQIQEVANGDIIAGGFSAPAGVYRYDSDGNQIGFWDVGTAVRGVYELGNWNILYTSGAGVFSLDPTTGLSATIVADGSYRFVEFVNLGGGSLDVCTTANNLTVFRGIQLSGVLADSFASDDVFLSFNPGFTLNSTEAPVWLVFDGGLADVPSSSLNIVFESNAGTPGITVTTEAFNFATGSFDTIDAQAEAFNNDSVKTLDVSSGLSDYVDGGGNIRTRIGWRQTGFTLNFPWEIRLDQAIWKSN